MPGIVDQRLWRKKFISQVRIEKTSRPRFEREFIQGWLDRWAGKHQSSAAGRGQIRFKKWISVGR
jgi:hypothetical protein